MISILLPRTQPEELRDTEKEGLTASWDLGTGMMMASTQMSWKMAPRKSPYRSRFSRNVGSGTSGGEKSRSEAMAPAIWGLLWLTTFQSQLLKAKGKCHFLQLTFKWSYYTTRTHIYMQEYIKQLWWNQLLNLGGVYMDSHWTILSTFWCVWIFSIYKVRKK